MPIQDLNSGKMTTKLIDRLAYSRDASVYRMVPEAVLRPENEEDIKTILKHASREKTPVTFRTGGTSLSGQAVTNGYIVEVLRGWQEFKIIENGNKIRVQPGLTGAYVNGLLHMYGRKIGPDPASIKAARIGGIVANNASGMVCGVTGNSYHTISSIRFIMANGNSYDTGDPEDRSRFCRQEKELHDGLLNIRKQINESSTLKDRIRKKYRIKNTIGYSMNSFLDFEYPLDIFAHLLIGSEGTLAFIAEVTFNTVPDPPFKQADLFFFKDPGDACRAVPGLKGTGPASIELMDRASLDTSKYIKGLDLDLTNLSPAAAALLIEFQGDEADSILKNAEEAVKMVRSEKGQALLGWQSEESVRNNLWALRKGLYPTVGSFRKPGTSVITEDLCFDISNLGDAVEGLQRIFKKNGTNDAVIFGHAQDGNLHFVASTDLNDSNASRDFGILMKDLVDMTLGQFDGSLKGEHGTGRNMAPFVENEWGSELYAFMQKIKVLADPDNILNPGVILNGGNETIHIESLKKLPLVNKEVDLCIECGFCETVCPSRELSLTPRQRITILRELEQNDGLSKSEKDQIQKDFSYMGLDTCAVDGLCELSCPVNINTGELVAQYRGQNNSNLKKELASLTLKNFKPLSSGVRFSLEIGTLINRNNTFANGINRFTRRLPVRIPEISSELPGPASDLPSTHDIIAPDIVYFPTCLTRTMAPGKSKGNLADEILEIGRLAGKKIHIPENVKNVCCGVPYHSKGYQDVNIKALSETVLMLFQTTKSGNIPVLVDTSPCTNQLRHGGEVLSGEILEKWKTLVFLDINEFLKEAVSGRTRQKLDISIAVHPTCSTEKMGQTMLMTQVSKTIAKNAEVSPDWNCCAFAGDRGIWFPELTGSATRKEAAGIKAGGFDFGVSSSRTCEAGMERATGLEFRPLASLVLEYLQQIDE